MEHIMNFSTKRQLQSIGHITDALEHLEGSVILRPKLGATPYVQGSCWWNCRQTLIKQKFEGCC
uniref:Uncharacterized protein n=1 Tax=Kalanchoe fedtschenkoi TaxID=63787 RepID=A0A7N0V9H6_KALFE